MIQTKRNFKKCILKSLLIIVSIFYIVAISAQQRLIEESLAIFGNLSTAENERVSKIQSKGIYTDYYIIEFGNVRDLQSEGEITINLPDDDCEDLIFKAKSVEL